MSKNFIFSFLIFAACWFALPGFALATGLVEKVDSGAISLHKPSAESIQKFKSQKDYQYNRQVYRGPGWWEQFMNWLSRKLDKKIPDGTSKAIWDVIKTIVVIAAALLVLYWLFQSEMRGLFYKNRTSGNNQIEELLQKSETDLDSFLKLAIEQADYNQAVKWYYIKTLKLLTEQGVIKWRQEKTNHQYFAELNEHGIRNQFERLTNFFEYSTYGHFELNKQHLSTVEELFARMNRNFNSPKTKSN